MMVEIILPTRGDEGERAIEPVIRLPERHLFKS